MELIDSIVCGDCIAVMEQLPDECIDLFVTSPPYYNARSYSVFSSISEYMEFLRRVFSQCYRALRPSRMCVVNISSVIIARVSRQHQSYRIPLPFYLVPMMEEIGYEFLEDIIWVKPEGSVPNRNGGFAVHRKPVAYKPNLVTEYILVFKKPAAYLIDAVLRDDSLVPDGYERTNVWYMNVAHDTVHPAPFPLALAHKVILYYSYRDELVCDPFVGSGTTAVACAELGRRYIGIESNEEYCAAARVKLKQLMLF